MLDTEARKRLGPIARTLPDNVEDSVIHAVHAMEQKLSAVQVPDLSQITGAISRLEQVTDTHTAQIASLNSRVP